MSARSPGEIRRRKAKRERDLAAHNAKMAELREAGRSCASCSMFEKAPWHMGGHICDLDSGGGAYARTTADNLCTRWSATHDDH